jgi:hypothetical protein
VQIIDSLSERMKSFGLESSHDNGKTYKVKEALRRIYSDTVAFYFPLGTIYRFASSCGMGEIVILSKHGNQTFSDISLKETDADSYTTIYIPVDGLWVARPRVIQSPEELLLYTWPGQIASDKSFSYNKEGHPFLLPLDFWGPNYVRTMVKYQPKMIYLIRDLGLTFIIVEQFAIKAGLDSAFADRYPKSKLQSFRRHDLTIEYGALINEFDGKIVEVKDIIRYWFNDRFDFNNLRTVFLAYEKVIDITMTLDNKRPEDSVNILGEFYRHLVIMAASRGLVIQFDGSYPIGADKLFPTGTLLGQPWTSKVNQYVINERLIEKELQRSAIFAAYTDADGELPLVRLKDLKGKQSIYIGPRQYWDIEPYMLINKRDERYNIHRLSKSGVTYISFRDLLDPRDVPLFICRYLQANLSISLRFLKLAENIDAVAVLSELRRHYLWHYSTRVVEAMLKNKSLSQKDKTLLYMTYPQFIPNDPSFMIGSIDEFDKPRLTLPRCGHSMTKRVIHWSLDFNRCNYTGTPYEFLLSPKKTTRENYALILSSLPLENMDGISFNDMTFPEAFAKDPTNLIAQLNGFLDVFYEATSHKRKLSDVPYEDRSYEVCKKYELSVADLPLLPPRVLLRLSKKYRYDAKFVTLEMLANPDEELRDNLWSVPCYLGQVLKRIHGDGKVPTIADPLLITNICLLGAGCNCLSIVPKAFRTPEVCIAYWKANKANIQFIPLAMRTSEMI